MTLTKVILEFQNKNIPRSIAKAISEFDSVGEVELVDDSPFAGDSSEAYVYDIQSGNKVYVLRISKKVAEERYWSDQFEAFEGHNFPNIVDVYLAREIKGYDVTVMETMHRILDNSAEWGALDDLKFMIFSLQPDERPKVMEQGIIDYAYGDEVYDTITIYEDEATKYKDYVVANIASGGISEKVTRDIVSALEDYYKVTGKVYDDLHPSNIMVDKNGTYKLIDL